MKYPTAFKAIPFALLAAFATSASYADANKVVIGDIDDMSGLYADVIGQGGVEAAKMAIDDFGGSVLGNKIELLVTDHQNKPDIGAQKFREWSDRNGLTMVLGGSNTGVSIAMATIAREKKTPFFAIGAAGASLTGKDCTPYTVHYAYDTTALGNGTASTIVKQGGKSWFFLTADYAFGTQLQDAASKVVEANGGKVIGAVRVPLSNSDFSSFLLQAQSSGAQILGLANAGNDFSNSLKAFGEFGLGKTMKPAALLAFLSDIHALGLNTAQGLYLTTSWYWDLNDKTRQDEPRAHGKSGRVLFGDPHLPERRQGRRDHRPGQGDGRASQSQDRRHVHQQRHHPCRWSDGTPDVRHAGEDACGIESTMGLLSFGADDVRRGSFRKGVRFYLPTCFALIGAFCRTI
jgi:branched-chain amino acid transport system substrate-binding protein